MQPAVVAQAIAARTSRGAARNEAILAKRMGQSPDGVDPKTG